MLKSFGVDTHTTTISLLKSFRDNCDYNSIEHTVLSLHQRDTRKAHKTQAHTRILIRLDSTITLEQLPKLGFDSSIYSWLNLGYSSFAHEKDPAHKYKIKPYLKKIRLENIILHNNSQNNL